MNVGLINLGYGNLFSIINAIKKIDVKINIILLRNKIYNNIDRIIFPGNGSLNCCLKNIKKFDFLEILKKKILTLPFMGICLGKQILFNRNNEGNQNGLGILRGTVKSFKSTEHKIPHIGWNNIFIKKKHNLLFNIKNKSYFYFAHSYYLEKMKNSYAFTEYINSFSSIFLEENFFLTQFHPENSSINGLKLIDNFLKWKI